MIRFHVINDGKDAHEFVVVRRTDDDRRSRGEIQALTPDQLESSVDAGSGRVAATFPAGSSADEAVLTLDLTPGRYLVLDSIPVGAKTDDNPDGGTPHYAKGNLAEFTVSENAPDVAKACEAEYQLNHLVQSALPFPEGEEPTQAETDAVKAFAADKLTPMITQLVANAPSTVASAAAAMKADVDALARDGDLSSWQSTATGPYAHYTAVALGLLSSCGRVIEVGASEYEYSGLPSSLPAGMVRFHLVNSGEEIHELALIRVPNGDDTAVEDLAKLSGDELFARYGEQFAGGADTTPAGGALDEAVLSVVLEPGRYLILCSFAKGSTDDDHQGSGAPHFHLGMLEELTVAAGDASDGK
jgi:hypothetical protein